MTQDSISVGLIGTGMIGSLHARNLAGRTRGAKLAAVMDIDQARASAVAAECGARAMSDANELIASHDVDALLIASPDDSHAELALACIQAGKPVLCEKPLATTQADGERVMQAEALAGRRLVQVGFMRVYDRAHRELYDLLQAGELGKALAFRGQHTNPGRGPISIDAALVNSLIHDIHSARWLMDAEIEQIYAQWLPSDAAEPRSARFALAHLRFEGGGIGTMEWNGDSGYGYEVAARIIGESGTAQSISHTSPSLRRGGSLSRAVTPDWPQRFAQAYRDEVQAWIDSLHQGRPTGPSAWDGVMSLAVAEAGIRSTWTGLPESVAALAKPALYQTP